ncbi:hypothetical protein JKP88DRAFT_200870 [Tribonema minus]|uniref:DUF1230 family protein n=1 Tax=Tribonema minus TaxID=303371 RepID=A0A836CC34_9STRA|nr:hypothetical protein JKP88DRAFT_200870 [Tribonema minus]
MLSEPGLQDVQGGPKILRRARGGKKVPLDQQPFNELQNLKEAPMFGWAQKDLNSFLLRLGGVYTGGALVSFPIARVTFPGDDQFAQLVLATNIGALGLVTALTLRLYAGWDYVAQRLDEDVVAYEQSGWYDGSTYAKPPDVQARDQMLSIYEARPVLKRLRVTLAVLASLFVTTIVAYRVLVPTDPYEMYGDAYLKDLPANEWKAKETAEASKAAGAKARPAYCGSRYYKALAGGNGCD